MRKPISPNFQTRTPRRRALTLLELVVVLLVLAMVAGIAAPLYTGVNAQAAGTATMKSLRTLQSVILSTYVPNMKGADITQVPNSSGIFYSLYTSAVVDPDGFPRGARTSLSSIDAQPMLVWLFQNPASIYGYSTNATSYNAAASLGWNGPYLSSGMGNYPGANANPAARGFAAGAYGNDGDPTVLDGWGNPIVIVPVTDQTGQQYYILLSAGPSGTLNLSPGSDGTVHITFDSNPTTNPSGALITTVGSTTYQYWMPLR